MERSRRQRLSEIYGESLGTPRTPGSLRHRLSKDHEERDRQLHASTLKSADGKAPDLPEKLIVVPENPLIPARILDVGSQRAFVLVLIGIIQAYKIYDLILFKNSMPFTPLLGIGFPSQHFNFLTKYLFYDSAFIYFLPALRIPSLTYKKPVTILLITLMFLINFFLASELSFPLTSLLLSTWKKLNTKDLTVLGSAVPQGKIDKAKHFKGSHTIKILPENTIQLNPFQDSFCLPVTSSKYTVNVPIRLNSTSEVDFLQVMYTDFDTNTPTLLNYTKKDIKKFSTKNVNELYERDTVEGPNIHYLNLPVSKTGLYEVTQALDSKYLGLRSYRSPLIVPQCPTAKISASGAVSSDMCLGDSYPLKFTLTGVPPLKLNYKKFLNHDVQEFKDQSFQPEFFQSPLISHMNSKMFTRDQLGDLSWAKSQIVEVDLENPLNHVGDYSFRVDEVVDGLGNVVNFAENFGDDDELFKKYDLLQSFYSHDLPKASLEEKVITDSATKRALYLSIDCTTEGAGPYEALIEFVSEDGAETYNITHTVRDSRDEYKVQAAGTYTLLSVKSKYCPSIIRGRSSVSVSLPVAPTMSISTKPITDACLGQTGLNFDLSFVGAPPFTVQRKVFKMRNGQRTQVESKIFHSQGTRNRITYEPSNEGQYEIVFTQFSDSLHTEQIKLEPAEDYTFTTTMRVKPSAEIFNYHSGKSLCLGAQARIPVRLKGEPPFTLDYDIVETTTNKRTPGSLKGLTSNTVDIVTPQFMVGGDYIVSLTAVEDSTGCLVDLNGADAKIRVRREVPSVGFGTNGDSKIRIKEGETAHLPLILFGESNFQVTYGLYDNDGNFVREETKHFKDQTSPTLDVTQAGFYKLKSVKDSTCPGVVDAADTFEVTFLPKPVVSITEVPQISQIRDHIFEKKNVCQYQDDTIDLTLSGSPPFTVEYTIQDPAGRRSSKSISVATKFASLRLVNDKGGEYKYFITGVYDSIYSKQDLDKIHHTPDQITVKQHVSPSAKGEFKNKRKAYRTCNNNLLEKALLEPIKLNIEGNAPFSVTFEIFHESSSKSEFVTLNNVDSTSELKELYCGLNLGNHIVTIVKIVDSDGCIQDEFSSNNYVSLSITDTPKIHQLDSSVHYCVGDHIGYQLIGTPPFTIVYEFNGLQLKATEQSTQFTRLASEPGTISIVTLGDSSSNCVVNFTQPENNDQAEKLTIPVHDIPSVEVSQGDYYVQDIHEGDQAEIIFTFEGEPPFTLTYVRTEEVEGKRGKKKSQVVETHKVTDIYAYEYRVLTSLQGTYEPIEVSDAYCVARNE